MHKINLADDIYEDDSVREGEDAIDTTRQHPFEQLRLALVQGFCAPIGLMSVADSFVTMKTDVCIDETSQSKLVVVMAKPGVTRLIRVARGLELFLAALFLLGWTLYQLGVSVKLSEKIADTRLCTFTTNE